MNTRTVIQSVEAMLEDFLFKMGHRSESCTTKLRLSSTGRTDLLGLPHRCVKDAVECLE